MDNIKTKYVCFEITLSNGRTFMHFINIQNQDEFINDIRYLNEHLQSGLLKSIDRVFKANSTPGAW